MACPHMRSCALFPMFHLKAALRTWQINYCEGTYEECARYKLTHEGKRVPLPLLPNGKLLVVPAKVVANDSGGGEK